MDVGLALPQFDVSVPGEQPLRWRTVEHWARRSEALGFGSLWLADHLFWDVAKYGGPEETFESLQAGSAGPDHLRHRSVHPKNRARSIQRDHSGRNILENGLHELPSPFEFLHCLLEVSRELVDLRAVISKLAVTVVATGPAPGSAFALRAPKSIGHRASMHSAKTMARTSPTTRNLALGLETVESGIATSPLSYWKCAGLN